MFSRDGGAADPVQIPAAPLSAAVRRVPRGMAIVRGRVDVSTLTGELGGFTVNPL
jgi:hypothetical protein